MLKIRNLVLFLIILLFVGCQNSLEKKLLPEEEIQYSKEYFGFFKTKNFEAIYQPLNETLKTEKDIQKQLIHIAKFFPKDNAQKIDIVGSHTFTTTMKDKEIKKINLTFQHTFKNSWLLTSIQLERINNGKIIVNGVNVQPLNDSLENTNKFNLENKSFTHYIILAFAIIIPIFIVFTFIVFIRTPIEKRKWLWGFFILIGLIKFTINWSTGYLHISPLSLNLLGSSFSYSNEFSPVIISIGIPIGAILFWLKKRKSVKTLKENETS